MTDDMRDVNWSTNKSVKLGRVMSTITFESVLCVWWWMQKHRIEAILWHPWVEAPVAGWAGQGSSEWWRLDATNYQ